MCTAYQLHVLIALKSGSLSLLELHSLSRPVQGLPNSFIILVKFYVLLPIHFVSYCPSILCLTAHPFYVLLPMHFMSYCPSILCLTAHPFYVLLPIHFILTNCFLTSFKMYSTCMKLECDATLHYVLLENCTSFLFMVSVCEKLTNTCSTVLTEKLTDTRAVKKFPATYGTRRFITTFTSARHLSLS